MTRFLHRWDNFLKQACPRYCSGWRPQPELMSVSLLVLHFCSMQGGSPGGAWTPSLCNVFPGHKSISPFKENGVPLGSCKGFWSHPLCLAQILFFFYLFFNFFYFPTVQQGGQVILTCIHYNYSFPPPFFCCNMSI